jgi:hypothetical protein
MLSGDMRILTREGYTKVKDLSEDYVIPSGSKETWNILFKTGDLVTCTDDQLFYYHLMDRAELSVISLKQGFFNSKTFAKRLTGSYPIVAKNIDSIIWFWMGMYIRSLRLSYDKTWGSNNKFSIAFSSREETLSDDFIRFLNKNDFIVNCYRSNSILGLDDTNCDIEVGVYGGSLVNFFRGHTGFDLRTCFEELPSNIWHETITSRLKFIEGLTVGLADKTDYFYPYSNTSFIRELSLLWNITNEEGYYLSFKNKGKGPKDYGMKVSDYGVPEGSDPDYVTIFVDEVTSVGLADVYSVKMVDGVVNGMYLKF